MQAGTPFPQRCPQPTNATLAAASSMWDSHWRASFPCSPFIKESTGPRILLHWAPLNPPGLLPRCRVRAMCRGIVTHIQQWQCFAVGVPSNSSSQEWQCVSFLCMISELHFCGCCVVCNAGTISQATSSSCTFLVRTRTDSGPTPAVLCSQQPPPRPKQHPASVKPVSR